ncbi:MAG: hypothetical protein Q8S75_06555, partial [Nitrospirota bacterium]|nr:hypothetical protein [Nitrospirota bacterium]
GRLAAAIPNERACLKTSRRESCVLGDDGSRIESCMFIPSREPPKRAGAGATDTSAEVSPD